MVNIANSPHITIRSRDESPWQQLPAVLRLIEAFPILSAALLLGSVLLAIRGFSLERQARRALQGQPASGQVAWSQRRAASVANVAQALQLMPLIVIAVASFVAPFTLPPLGTFPFPQGALELHGILSFSLQGVIVGLLLGWAGIGRLR